MIYHIGFFLFSVISAFIFIHIKVLTVFTKLINSYKETLELLRNKNHDYGEAWRDMWVSSMTDLILMKIFRTKQIENNLGVTLVSEGVEANYQDMLNYAVFCLIKLKEEQSQQAQQ
mgnify:CR=1 FL=1